LLCGTHDFIRQARRWRKLLGGGMRQSGILAAAGIHALQHNIDRLAEDHANAALLASALQDVPQVHIDPAMVQTNMVFLTVPGHWGAEFKAFLAGRGMLISLGAVIRLVTHLDVSREDMLAFAGAVGEYARSH